VHQSPVLVDLTIIAVIFAFIMGGILLARVLSERRTELNGVEMYVTPYLKKPSLLAPGERILFNRLIQAVGNTALVCPKVRVADILDVRGDAMEWQTAWNRIAARHVDFLLISSTDHKPLLAIELNVHGRRDDWVDQAMVLAGLPLLRITQGFDYNVEALKAEIDRKISARI
jgi:hypothetical protein